MVKANHLFSVWVNVLILQLIQWLLDNIFTIKPITDITIPYLLGLYLIYILTGFVLILIPASILYSRWKRERPNREIPSIKEIIGYVLLEEAIFRAFPLIVLGNWALLPFHFLDAIAHWNVPQSLWILYSTLLELRLWSGGLWYYAVPMHLIHDFLWVAGIHILARREQKLLNNKLPHFLGEKA